MLHDFKVASVFESQMTVDAEVRLPFIFDTSILDHMIKFHHEDADDILAEGRKPRKILYRVIIEVADLE